MEFPRQDLMAINIQRGRDHGVPDYNSARRSMGLDPIKSFDTFISQTKTTVHVQDPEVFHFYVVNFVFKLYSHFLSHFQAMERFKQLYINGTIDNVDLWAGGLLETELGPGQLFRAILKDQFTRIRSADRFWYANLDNK